MSKEENLLWLQEAANRIASIKETQECLRLKWKCPYQNVWFVRSYMPLCADQFGYVVGQDVVLSINAKFGWYDPIKKGAVLCVWMWVSTNGEFVDSASVYFDRNGKVYVSPCSGELAIACMRQSSGAFEAFCIDYFLFLLQHMKIKEHLCEIFDSYGRDKERLLKEDEDYAVWSQTWSKIPRNMKVDVDYDFVCTLPAEPMNVYLGTKTEFEEIHIEISNKWFRHFLRERKREKMRKNGITRVLKGLWHNPLVFLFMAIGFMYSCSVDISALFTLVVSYIAGYSAVAVCMIVYAYIHGEIDTTPYTFPAELKELAYLRCQGYEISFDSHENEFNQPTKLHYFGFMEELVDNTYGFTRADILDISEKKIPLSLAKKLGLEKCTDWWECYKKLTSWKVEDDFDSF